MPHPRAAIPGATAGGHETERTVQATTSPGNHSTHPGLECRPDQVPRELTDGAPFVNFRVKPKPNGKWDKIPTNPTGLRNAKVDDPDTFGTFEQARANLGRPGVAGLS